MKRIGLVGGLSWHSSIEYYRLINQLTNDRLGGNEAARIILYSVNYGEIVRLTMDNDWDRIAAVICNAARKTDEAGADCILIGANTMHRIAHQVQQSVTVPVIHIARETARAIAEAGLSRVALLGTRYTMESDFYPEELAARNITMLLPEPEERTRVHDAIYHEMGKGKFLPETRADFIRIIRQLQDRGAEGVILGCTEIPILLQQRDSPIPVFDTTLIHATAAVNFALK